MFAAFFSNGNLLGCTKFQKGHTKVKVKVNYFNLYVDFLK